MRLNFKKSDGTVLTEIKVNPVTKKVKIVNYTDNVFCRAFGANENPTYADVIHFLEKRTVPKNRGDIKEILEEVGLKEYDPYFLCKFFGGRMAQDDFCVEFL